MSQNNVSILEKLLGDFQGISYTAILIGLLLAAINSFRFLSGSVLLSTRKVSVSTAVTTRAIFWAAVPSIVWPLLFVWAGFLIGSPGSTFAQCLIVLVVVVALRLSVHMLEKATDPGADVSGVALSIVLSLSTLVLFGLLFMARLITARTPEVFDGGVDLVGDSLTDTAKTILLAPFVLLILLTLIAVIQRDRRVGEEQTGSGLSAIFGGARKAITSTAPARLRGNSGIGGITLGAVAVFVLFAAPFASPDHLSIGGVQTQEIGIIAYFAVLALVLVRYGYRFRVHEGGVGHEPSTQHHSARPPRTPHVSWLLSQSRAQVHILLPIGLFAMVAIVNRQRGDLGPLGPMALATVPVILYVVRVQSRRADTVSGHGDRTGDLSASRNSVRYIRSLLAVAVALSALVGIVALASYGPNTHGAGRLAVWSDPWVYPWNATCSAPPPGYQPLTESATLPPDTEPCLLSYPTAEASTRSQVAQAVSVLNDGGLWGRGLADTTSGRVPVGSYDFILALIWSKLGAFVVVLLSVLMALLAFALVRLPVVVRYGRTSTLPRDVTFAPLFAAGIAAVILLQYILQLAMTVGMVPHSGLTAPFLSRGFQSTIALGAAVIIAVALAYREATGSPDERPGFVTVSTRSRPRLPSAFLAFAVSLVLILGVIVTPYHGLSEARPLCTPDLVDADTGRVDSSACSTDLLAFTMSEARIQVNGKPEFATVAGTWTPNASADLSIADMGGILLPGVLDRAVAAAGKQPDQNGMRARLLPPAPRGGTSTLDLSLAPGIQRAVATATESDGPGSASPLPAGVAVLDAKSGRVLALASAPTQRAAVINAKPERSWEEQGTFDHELKEFNRGVADWKRNGVDTDVSTCDTGVPVSTGCFTWRAVEKAPRAQPRDPAELRRFVEDDTTAQLPSDAENRFSGTRYGVGSTFKVVIAAAYLRRDGTTANDLIPAPVSVRIGSQVIENVGKTECRLSANGQISLTNALAVSCNTAFVQLADTLGWDTIRDTAESFGFRVNNSAGEGGAWLTGPGLGIASTVPSEADSGKNALGNIALGGGSVEATPLQMATVMATIANGGVAVQPSLITRIANESDPDATWTSEPQTRAAMSPQAATQLRVALSKTTAAGGTADGLAAVDGRQIWAKSGTHEMVPPDQPNKPGDFTRQMAWMVGFVETTSGPIAFAIRVATRDEKAGAQRVRWLAQRTIDAIIEEHG